MTSRCPRCGRPLVGRDSGSLQHSRNVRSLIVWFVAFPFTLGAAVALGVVAGVGAIR
jgi:hypothetical protein